MRVKELHAGLSGVLPLASFENLRPSFDITVEIQEGEDIDKAMTRMKEFLRTQFDMEANRCRVDLIEKQYSNIRFREKDGKKYPSVTSITDWDKDWRITDDELRQYGARGTIVHKLIEEYIKTGIWPEPEMLPDLREDLIILATGSLNLTWKSCSHQKFFEQFEKYFEFHGTEQEVYNSEHLYSGRYDARGLYKGKVSIIDFKTGSSYSHLQTAAYAVCEKDIEQLVICPVGVTPNKSGYKKPNVTEDIKGNFRQFLKARTKFRQRFGV